VPVRPLTINSPDLVRNASTILGFNVFLQTPERLGKDHDEVVALAAAKKYRAFVGKTFPAAEVAEATRHLESHKSAGKVVLTFADFVYVPVTIVHPGGGFEMREEGRCYRIIDDESSREQGSGKLGALATDTTLPLAMPLSHTRFVPEKYRGLLSPEHFGGTRGLFLLEPYDSNKVPILMIHGLMSSPLTWKELTNELLGDAYVRTHYQIWHYVYPTGQSLFYTAKGLRDSLDALKRAIALAHLPQPKPMVVIGHSMYQLDRALRFQTGSPERRLERRKSASAPCGL
jgi:Zinc-binding dehydrogenase